MNQPELTLSPVDQAYDAMAAHAQDVVNRAFAEYPLDDKFSADNRWGMICDALEKTDEALKSLVNLTEQDGQCMIDESQLAIDANSQYRKDAVAESVGAYLYIFRAAIDRQGAL